MAKKESSFLNHLFQRYIEEKKKQAEKKPNTGHVMVIRIGQPITEVHTAQEKLGGQSADVRTQGTASFQPGVHSTVDRDRKIGQVGAKRDLKTVGSNRRFNLTGEDRSRKLQGYKRMMGRVGSKRLFGEGVYQPDLPFKKTITIKGNKPSEPSEPSEPSTQGNFFDSLPFTRAQRKKVHDANMEKRQKKKEQAGKSRNKRKGETTSFGFTS